MYENSLITPRQIIRYGLLLVVVVAVGLALWFIFTHGGIKVKTASSSAEISVSPENNQNMASASGTGKSFFSFIRNGHYIVTVKEGKKQTRTAVDVSSFSTKEVTLIPPDIQFSEAVTNISAPYFAVSSSSLSLLDTTEGELASVDLNNYYQHTDTTTNYESVVWLKAGEGYAVGRKSDTNDRILVKIIDNKPQVITTPKPITSETYLAFYVTSNGTFYLLQDGELYSSTGDGNYQPRGGTNKEASILSANNQFIAFLYRNSEEQCEIQFLKLSDKTLTKRSVTCIQDPSYAYSASWSPDAKNLALTTGKSLEILDENLAMRATIPDYTAAHPVWLNSDTLVYTSKNNVWSYTLSTNTASVIATTPQYVDVQSLRKADDSDELYFSGSADGAPTLYRIRHQGNDLSDIQKLSESNMQTLSRVCHTHYINFTKAQLVLSTAESTRAECTDETKSYLSSIDTSISSFQYDIREEFGYTDYLNEPTD
jgi:hypothetical protein